MYGIITSGGGGQNNQTIAASETDHLATRALTLFLFFPLGCHFCMYTCFHARTLAIINGQQEAFQPISSDSPEFEISAHCGIQQRREGVDHHSPLPYNSEFLEPTIPNIQGPSYP